MAQKSWAYTTDSQRSTTRIRRRLVRTCSPCTFLVFTVRMSWYKSWQLSQLCRFGPSYSAYNSLNGYVYIGAAYAQYTVTTLSPVRAESTHANYRLNASLLYTAHLHGQLTNRSSTYTCMGQLLCHLIADVMQILYSCVILPTHITKMLDPKRENASSFYTHLTMYCC